MLERKDGFIHYMCQLAAARTKFADLITPPDSGTLPSHPNSECNLLTEMKISPADRARIISQLPRRDGGMFGPDLSMQLWILTYEVLNKPVHPLPPQSNDFLADLFLITASSHIGQYEDAAFGTGTLLQITLEQMQANMIYRGTSPENATQRKARMHYVDLWLNAPLTRTLAETTFPNQFNFGVPRYDTFLEVTRIGLEVLTGFGLVNAADVNHSKFFSRYSIQPALADALYKTNY